jgi:DNA-binding CsgD family transcriptional regulator
MHSFERLVDRIYEAATEPDEWPGVLHDISRVVDAAGGLLVTRRNDSPWLGWRCSGALVPRAEAYITSGAAARSQTTPRLLAANSNGFVADHELFTEEEFLADPLMTEWAGPNGLHRGAATAIHVPTGDLIVFQVQRLKGLPALDPADLEQLNALRPHLARAGLMAARWQLERMRATAEALALVGLPAAVLDGAGKVLAANDLIQTLASHVVWGAKDRLALVDKSANAVLQQALRGLEQPAVAIGRSFPAAGTDGRPVVAHLVPTAGQARDLFAGGYGLLVVTPVTGPRAPDMALIQGLFDLSAAEARVAGCIVEGLTIEQIAGRNGVSAETVRTQVKAVFAKTGTSRQAQVAALLAGLPRIPHP